MNPPPETSATLDPKQAEREAIKDINQDYKTKFGFNDPETGYVYNAPKGLSRQLVEDICDLARRQVDDRVAALAVVRPREHDRVSVRRVGAIGGEQLVQAAEAAPIFLLVAAVAITRREQLGQGHG